MWPLVTVGEKKILKHPQKPGGMLISLTGWWKGNCVFRHVLVKLFLDGTYWASFCGHFVTFFPPWKRWNHRSEITTAAVLWRMKLQTLYSQLQRSIFGWSIKSIAKDDISEMLNIVLSNSDSSMSRQQICTAFWKLLSSCLWATCRYSSDTSPIGALSILPPVSWGCWFHRTPPGLAHATVSFIFSCPYRQTSYIQNSYKTCKHQNELRCFSD